MKQTTWIVLTAFTGLTCPGLLPAAQTGSHGVAPDTLDLSGTWRFALDPADTGLAENWERRRLQDHIRLPGTTDLAGKGHRLDRRTMTYPVDFIYSTFPAVAPAARADARGFLVRAYYYLGRAWYQRDIEIPEAWSGKLVKLELERVLWESRAWIDGRFLGTCDSLVAPHRYALGALVPGAHTLTVAVDNRMIHNTGTIGHAYGPETQSRWNGIVGQLRLAAFDKVHVAGLRAFPAADRRSVEAEVTLRNSSTTRWTGQLALSVLPLDGGDPVGAHHRTVTVNTGEIKRRVLIPLHHPADPWDEFSTVRYRLAARLTGEDVQSDRATVFGFRCIQRHGRHIRINGRRVFLRGTLDCCVYPKTGHPPVTVGAWLRVLGTIRSYGCNHVRYHSWCPPEAAFEAADRLGLYLAPETSFWVDDWTTQTYSKPRALGRDPAVLDFVRREIGRISDAYGNHPSFAFFCIGNELGMKGSDWNVVNGLIEEAKRHDPRRLYNATTARRRVAADDYWVTHRSGPRTRGVGPPHTGWDFARAAAAADLPVIAHETGQRPVFPDYHEFLQKFTGPLKPYNYIRLRDALDRAGLLEQVRDFEQASARFQLVQYKAEHEGMLRTADCAGYQLLMLNDFTGQSEALIGILDPFWESKGVISREEVLRWNAPTVPLARFARYVWSSDQVLEAAIEVAHYGPADLPKASAAWKLSAGATAIATGRLPAVTVPTGTLTPLGSISVPLGGLTSPTALTLIVTVEGAENQWNLWAYPPGPITEAADTVLLTEVLGERELQTLRHGGRVVLLAHGLKNDRCARTGFLSVYWSAGWWGNQFSSLGILCDPEHPALARFPSDGHSDWQWHELTEGATTFLLDGAPGGFRPIVQPVTDFHHNRLLAHVFEARVGTGALLVCGYDLTRNLSQRHAARSFRTSLLEYAAGPHFHPRYPLPLAYVKALLVPPLMQRLGAEVLSTDSQNSGYEAAKAIDGDPATMWHTQWHGGSPGFPHELTVRLKKPVTIRGVSLLPRQDGNLNGRIRECEIYLSTDGRQWGEPAARSVLANAPERQDVRFAAPKETRFLRLRALSGFDDQPFASLAELSVLIETE